MEKIIRKLILPIILVFTCFLTSCSSSDISIKELKEDYDREIIDFGKQTLKIFNPENEITYQVERKEDCYVINVNDTIISYPISISNHISDYPEYAKSEEVSNTNIINLANSSKTLVIDYIKKSKILKDKKMLIQMIEVVPIMYSDAGKVVEYYNGVIYINKQKQKYISEWLFVHALTHYLCELTNGSINNNPYRYTMFDETITDIITSSMEPQSKYNSFETYAGYNETVLTYIGYFQEKALEAYFYGYDSIYEETGKDSFDIFVQALDDIETDGIATIIVYNSINHWITNNK